MGTIMSMIAGYGHSGQELCGKRGKVMLIYTLSVTILQMVVSKSEKIKSDKVYNESKQVRMWQ